MFTGKGETGWNGGAEISIAARMGSIRKRGMTELDSIQKEDHI
jgi:hypothetical protein